MEALIQDIRYALRVLINNPLFSLVSIFTLVLGIGANTVVFSAVNSILLRPLPYENTNRIAQFWLTELSRGINKMPLSVPELTDYRQESDIFDAIAGYYDGNFNVMIGGEPQQIPGSRFTTNLLSVLGARPMLGRDFNPEEEQPGKHRVVLLSHKLWQSRFNSDPGIIDQSININTTPYTVIGVMPPGFEFPTSEAEIWVPLAIRPGTAGRDYRLLRALALLKPGETVEQAQQRASIVASRLEQQFPENVGVGVNFLSLQDSVLGDIRLPLQVLLGAVGLVLLIVCANVASLLLARASAREKEITIRTALGAGRGRLIRQLLTESVILGLLGGAAGYLLATLGIKLLIAISPKDIPRVQGISMDSRVLLFAIVISLLTSIVFGLVPALQASRADLQGTLKEGRGSSNISIRGRSIFKTLVVVEVALALVLLIAAGLVVNSFMHLGSVNLGINTENLLTMQVSLPPLKYQDATKVVGFYEQLLDGIQNLPSVEAAGITQAIPLGSGEKYYMLLDAEAHSDPNAREGRPIIGFFQVSPNYFKAMGTPLLAGRNFDDRDAPDSQPVCIISEAASKLFFPGEDSIGQRIRVGSPGNWGPWATIVGVVADMRYDTLNNEPPPQVYAMHRQGFQLAPLVSMMVAVRASGNASSLTNAIREQVKSLDREQPIARVLTMNQIVSEALAQRRFSMILLGVFATIAMILAAVGIAGVMSYSVTQRRHEIGIRMALGAQPRDVLKLIVGQGMMLTVIGVGLGLVGAYFLTRLLTSLLYGVSASDPVTFALLSLLLVGVALLANYVPARRATKIDPVEVLRYE
jgi:predicted permease